MNGRQINGGQMNEGQMNNDKRDPTPFSKERGET